MTTTSGVDSPVSERRAVVNFSRPRVNSDATTDLGKSRPATPNVKSLNAFHEEPIKDEFTLDTNLDRNNLPSSDSNSTQFSWDAQHNELISRRQGPQLTAKDQRHPGQLARMNSSGNETSGSSTTDESLKLLMPKSILKHTRVEQYSERASSDAGESGASHHTMSEEGGGGSGGSFDEYGKWTSSDYDISGLSEKEIKKLEKKGVNPKLYAEMKAARKGKSCVSGLTGNAYVA